MSDAVRPPFSRWASLGLSIIPVVAASTLGSLATLQNIPSWYVNISKPWFTPPNWVFGPVWTLIFSIIALAFYRVLRRTHDGGKTIIFAFLLQASLNAGWSAGFFGGRSPLLGLIIIVPLWLSIAWTLALFWERDRIAGLCFVPYLLWVTFAGALNLGIWWLNR